MRYEMRAGIILELEEIKLQKYSVENQNGNLRFNILVFGLRKLMRCSIPSLHILQSFFSFPRNGFGGCAE